MKNNLLPMFALTSILCMSTQCDTAQSERENSLANIQNNVSQIQIAEPGVTSNQIVNDPVSLPVKAEIDGKLQEAFLVAFEALKKDPDIPEAKKKLKHYRIEFREYGQLYYVLFAAEREPNDDTSKGGESDLAKDVMYILEKRDYNIVKRLFFK